MEFIAIFSPTHGRDPLEERGSTIVRFKALTIDGARQRLGELPIVRSGIACVQVFPLVSLYPEDGVLAPN